MTATRPYRPLRVPRLSTTAHSSLRRATEAPSQEKEVAMQMTGKTVLITGANSGVGYATASQLAVAGAEIVMVCRDADRAADAQRKLAGLATGPAPAVFLADLSSQSDVRRLADQVGSRYDQIDVLLNNAGGVFAKRELSVDGIEKTFATNHLAPFLLTNLLLGPLRAAPAARIVTVATEIYSRNSTSTTCRASGDTSSSRPTRPRSSPTSCLPSSWPVG